MFRIRKALVFAAASVLVLAVQPAAPQDTPPAAQPGRPRDIQLVFEREIFHYQGAARRDPFRSLANDDGMGPLFDDLKLRMIIHSDRPGQSVALLVAGANKVYRLRKGDVVGNATVLEITATRVVFSVEDYGNRRQEILDLKNLNEGA